MRLARRQSGIRHLNQRLPDDYRQAPAQSRRCARRTGDHHPHDRSDHTERCTEILDFVQACFAADPLATVLTAPAPFLTPSLTAPAPFLTPSLTQWWGCRQEQCASANRALVSEAVTKTTMVMRLRIMLALSRFQGAIVTC